MQSSAPLPTYPLTSGGQREVTDRRGSHTRPVLGLCSWPCSRDRLQRRTRTSRTALKHASYRGLVKKIVLPVQRNVTDKYVSVSTCTCSGARVCPRIHKHAISYTGAGWSSLFTFPLYLSLCHIGYMLS